VRTQRLSLLEVEAEQVALVARHDFILTPIEVREWLA
jgi:hypothetical protein